MGHGVVRAPAPARLSPPRCVWLRAATAAPVRRRRRAIGTPPGRRGTGQGDPTPTACGRPPSRQGAAYLHQAQVGVLHQVAHQRHAAQTGKRYQHQGVELAGVADNARHPGATAPGPAGSAGGVTESVFCLLRYTLVITRHRRRTYRPGVAGATTPRYPRKHTAALRNKEVPPQWARRSPNMGLRQPTDPAPPPQWARGSPKWACVSPPIRRPPLQWARGSPKWACVSPPIRHPPLSGLVGAQNGLASAHRSGDPPVRQNHPRWACRNPTFPLCLPRAPGPGRTPRRPPRTAPDGRGGDPTASAPGGLPAPPSAPAGTSRSPTGPRPASAIRADLTPLGAMPGAEQPAGGGTLQGAHRPPGRAAFAGGPGGGLNAPAHGESRKLVSPIRPGHPRGTRRVASGEIVSPLPS